jgi:hypothetical protein
MIGRGNRSTWRKPAPVPLCPPQTPHAARTRTRAAAVGSQRLIAELRHGLWLHFRKWLISDFRNETEILKSIASLQLFWQQNVRLISNKLCNTLHPTAVKRICRCISRYCHKSARGCDFSFDNITDALFGRASFHWRRHGTHQRGRRKGLCLYSRSGWN